MACGCVDSCNCFIQGANGISVTGSGSAGSPYVITAPNETLFNATNTDGTIDIIPGGTAGHTPVFNLNLDPASTAPVSTSVAGLRIDCCSTGDGIASATDTFSIDHTVALGNLTSDVILNPLGGLETLVSGVSIRIDPASTAPISISGGGLRVDNPADGTAIQVFTVGGNFTKASYPNANWVRVRLVGGGGGSGGCAATGVTDVSSGAGGGGGGYSERLIAMASLGALEAVTVGAGGLAGTAGGANPANTGGTGGTSTFGTVPFLSGVGGVGGDAGPVANNIVGPQFATPGAGGTASGGDIVVPGGDGGFGCAIGITTGAGQAIRNPTNFGGNSVLGGISRAGIAGATSGTLYGAGAGGPSNAVSLAARAGAAGSQGVVIVEIF